MEISWHMKQVRLGGEGTVITDAGKGFIFSIGNSAQQLTPVLIHICYSVLLANVFMDWMLYVAVDTERDHHLCHYHLLDKLGPVQKREEKAQKDHVANVGVQNQVQDHAIIGVANGRMVTNSIRSLVVDVYHKKENWEKELCKVEQSVMSQEAKAFVKKIKKNKESMTTTWAQVFTNGQTAQQRAEGKHSHVKTGDWGKLLRKSDVHVITDRILQMEQEQIRKTVREIKRLRGEWADERNPSLPGLSKQSFQLLSLTLANKHKECRIPDGYTYQPGSRCLVVEHFSPVESEWFQYKVYFKTVTFLGKVYEVPSCDCPNFKRTKRPCGGVALLVDRLQLTWSSDLYDPRWRVPLHPLYSLAMDQQDVPVAMSSSSNAVSNTPTRFPQTPEDMTQAVREKFFALMQKFAMNSAAYTEWMTQLERCNRKLELTVQRGPTQIPGMPNRFPTTPKAMKKAVREKFFDLMRKFAMNSAAYTEWMTQLERCDKQLELTVQRRPTQIPVMPNHTSDIIETMIPRSNPGIVASSEEQHLRMPAGSNNDVSRVVASRGQTQIQQPPGPSADTSAEIPPRPSNNASAHANSQNSTPHQQRRRSRSRVRTPSRSAQDFASQIRQLPATGTLRRLALETELGANTKQHIVAVLQALNLNSTGHDIKKECLVKRAVDFGKFHYIKNEMQRVTAIPQTAHCSDNSELMKWFVKKYNNQRYDEAINAPKRGRLRTYNTIIHALERLPIAITSGLMLQALTPGIGDKCIQIIDEILAKKAKRRNAPRNN